VFNHDTMSALMPSDTVYITSLREPFSQFKSMVNYYNLLNISGVKQQTDGQDRFSVYLTDIASYDAVYTSSAAAKTRYCIPDGFQMSRNLMSYNLGFPTGFPEGVTASDRSGDDAFIKTWLDGVSARFKHVIMTEWFYESMILVRREMCWSLRDILFSASNALSYGYKSRADARLVDLYRAWSRVDYALYAQFNATFHATLAQQDEQFWKEVDHYRTVNYNVSTFCAASQAETGEERKKDAIFYVQDSYYNTRFGVDSAFCEQLLDELNDKKLHEFYEQQPPVGLVEPTPSKITC